ncbi:MAG TPA: amidohydrolase [Acidimicrobiia bacterium]|nr:amidohydrolase [Acidimicrobiia bacterium]
MAAPDFGHVRAAVAEFLPEVVELRRQLHRRPELAYREVATTELIETRLRTAGLEPRARSPRTGLVVEVGKGEHLVGFRSDLDALPIQEPEGPVHRSEIPGVMHACGHDVHTAIGAGLALVAARLELERRIRFVFQPAEEAFPGGGQELVAEGAAEGLAAIVAFHCDPTLEVGKVGMRSGPITASADRFFVTLEGPGGHTARPHRTVDLVFASGLLVSQLPGLIDRHTDARLPKAVVFGSISGGTAENVIPTRVELSGTCRTLDRGLWEEIPSLLERLVHEIVAPTGAKVGFKYVRGVPPVINNSDVVAACREAVSHSLGVSSIVEAESSMGAEDFSAFTEAVPGALMRLGVKTPGERSVDLHSASFCADEGAVEVGLLAGMASLLAI